MAVAALRMSDSGGRRKLNSSPDIPYKFLTTLIWAPAFPLLRLATTKLPHLRPYVIGGAIVVAAVFYGLTGAAREVHPQPPRQT